MSTLGTVIEFDLLVNRPSPSIPGRLFFATNIGVMYRDNGASWDTVGSFFGAGSTGQRPTLDSSAVGISFFDTTLTRPVWWTGVNWIKADGTVV